MSLPIDIIHKVNRNHRRHDARINPANELLLDSQFFLCENAIVHRLLMITLITTLLMSNFCLNIVKRSHIDSKGKSIKVKILDREERKQDISRFGLPYPLNAGYL